MAKTLWINRRRTERIAILITDINMPGMDGHELAHRATQIRPEMRVLQLSGASRDVAAMRQRRREIPPEMEEFVERHGSGRPAQLPLPLRRTA